MLPALAAIAAILILPAHASVIGTTPAAGDVLTEQPGTFSVTMNEQILSVEGADSANAIQGPGASARCSGGGRLTGSGGRASGAGGVGGRSSSGRRSSAGIRSTDCAGTT